MKGLTDPMVGPADGPDRGEPRAPLRHHARADGRVRGAQPPARRSRRRTTGISRPAAAKSSRSTTRNGKVYRARRRRARGLHAGEPREAASRSSTASTATSPPGNSSQITDGAAWLLLASEEAVKKHGLAADRPHRRLANGRALDPAQMGLGPVHAATPILKRHGLGLNDLDSWEINEAFAAQVLGCLAAWKRRQVLPRGARPRPGASGRARPGQAQRRRRRDRARPSGRRLGRAHRAAPAEDAEAHRREARHGLRSASAAAWAARCSSKRCKSK